MITARRFAEQLIIILDGHLDTQLLFVGLLPSLY